MLYIIGTVRIQHRDGCSGTCWCNFPGLDTTVKSPQSDILGVYNRFLFEGPFQIEEKERKKDIYLEDKYIKN